MKKIACLLAALVFTILTLTGCSSSEETKALNNYKTEMETFFTDLEEINTVINEIDPESETSISELFSTFDTLEEKFSYLAAIDVPIEGAPETFSYIEPLANEAADYMVQANGYMHDSFSDSSYNENTLAGAIECYKRANKRVQYIITLLHGEYPKDENISYN